MTCGPLKKHSSIRIWRWKTSGAAEHDHSSSCEIHHLQSDGMPVCVRHYPNIIHIKGNGWRIMPSSLRGGWQRYSSGRPPTPSKRGWSAPRPGPFTPVKDTLYTLYRNSGGPRDQSGRVRKSRPQRGSNPGPPRHYTRSWCYSIGLQLGGVTSHTVATAHNLEI
jgi:hypothetical protein